jgi:hypothetical protein
MRYERPEELTCSCASSHEVEGSGDIVLRPKEIVMRLVVAALCVVALVIAAPAAADRPAAFTFVDVFPDVNPCTGNAMTVTIAVNGFVHEHGSREVAYAERTITTSDGFVGRGTETFLFNGQIILFRQTDIMTSASGERFRAHGEFILDISTDTVRVENFELTCMSR